MTIFNELNDINKNFSNKGIKMRIEKRGNLLNFRGPLPCKANNDLIRTQRISLNLPANLEGLKKSEKLMQLLLLQLQHGQFDWKNWKEERQNNITKSRNSLSEVIVEFESIFFNEINSSKSITSKKTTWNSAYKPYLKRLQEISERENIGLDSNLFCETLKSYKENSRSRQQCSSSIGVFARHLRIDLPENWKKLGSGYGIKKYNFRELPDDNQIKQIWEHIPNPKWKLVYGIMATYGLRNHEVFFSDYSSLNIKGDNILRVLPNTKTGEHQVWPFHPEWVSFFGLHQLSKKKDILPKINLNLEHTSLQQVGRRVSEQFKRYNLPIKPYDLRHAWAIRTIHIGLPDTVSARMMGHSVSIHNRTYHHWITTRDQQQAVDRALSKNINRNY